ncbi:alpha/beta hydrolase [Massilia scottii]|uniref:alpha/beta hydrolase n=1 Tax=Massilia scottii TaxID=3057166 RepID=UPI002796B6C5|nr:alpha/beta hydrolase [Massilia sp. CCM 9029]MDQ1829209.1 alpha/beta hydrolase [Massilia sp. CCM 9029]
MSTSRSRKANTYARQAAAALFFSGMCLAQAAPTVSDILIKHNIKDGEVPSATLMHIISTAEPKNQDERDVVLGLKQDVLERYLNNETQDHKEAALALALGVVEDARELYGRDSARVIPVLRLAARVCLHYQERARAVTLLTDALRVSEIVYGADDPASRFVMRDLGQSYAAKGNSARADQLKKKAEYLKKVAPASIRGISVLASAPPAIESKPYQLVPVFFQTTRKKTGNDDPQAYFGTQRAGASSYGVSYVSVPRQRESGTIPHASILKLDFSTDPNRHVILKEISLYDGRAGFLKAITERMNGSARKESLVYIHGFNQSFQDGMETAGMLAVDLEIDGSVVSYAWPSKKNVLKYVADMDESNAVINKDALKELLADVSSSVGARSVYVIAHSMGNRLLLDALQLLPSSGDKRRFDSVIFASPDVESNEFETMVGKTFSQASRMTLYTAGSDIPLSLSELIRAGLFNSDNLRRAGDRDGGVKSHPYLDVVDASKAQADWLGHRNFAQLAKDDLRALLWLRVPATRRCVLQEQTGGWRYDPQVNCSSGAFGMATLYYRRLQDTAKAAAQLDSTAGPLAKQASSILKDMLPTH